MAPASNRRLSHQDAVAPSVPGSGRDVPSRNRRHSRVTEHHWPAHVGHGSGVGDTEIPQPAQRYRDGGLRRKSGGRGKPFRRRGVHRDEARLPNAAAVEGQAWRGAFFDDSAFSPMSFLVPVFAAAPGRFTPFGGTSPFFGAFFATPVLTAGLFEPDCCPVTDLP